MIDWKSRLLYTKAVLPEEDSSQHSIMLKQLEQGIESC